jgi:CBS-domain-containing membrane protein
MTTERITAPIVGDRMAIEPIVIRADASLTEAAVLMDQRHIHGLPVVDASGSLVGVLSQTDLPRARATEYLWSNWPGLAVRHLMTSPALTVHRSTRSRSRRGRWSATGSTASSSWTTSMNRFRSASCR